MSDFVYPTNVALQLIAQELVPRLTAVRPIFDIFPIREVDAHLLEWEQRDNFTGLQQVRGLNGTPERVKPVSGKRYLMTPGVYGEFIAIDELQLTTRRPYGTFQGAVNVSDLVLEAQNKLLGRRLDRIEQIAWTLLATGTFAVADYNSVLHTDSFTTQTFSAGVSWATFATATPLADLRSVQLKARGYSVDFGGRATAFMNRTTFNNMLSNTNQADLAGRRVTGFNTINGPEQLNQVLTADDLPNVQIYDQGYYDDTATFQLFIPNNKVILVGQRRDNDPVGEYRMTRNANNPGMSAGPYMRVVDEPDEIPRRIAVHDGHNGGPVLFHPAAIVVMSV